MDSIDERSQNEIAAIKEALLTGIITPAEMDARLNAFLDYETSKSAEEIDAGMVSACTDLLWELHAQETAQLPDHKDAQRAKLKAYLAKTKPKSVKATRTIRIVVATAAVFVLAMVGEALLSRQWLQSTQSPDEQQLVLQGKVVDPGLIEQVNASQAGGAQEVNTKSLAEVEAFLGFAPPSPTVIPDGWVLQSYTTARSSNAVHFLASFEREGEVKLLTFSFDRYLNAEFARAEIEQNKRGLLTKLRNGQEVYVTTNIDNSVCMRVDGLDVYFLAGPIDTEIMLEIAESIQ